MKTRRYQLTNLEAEVMTTFTTCQARSICHSGSRRGAFGARPRQGKIALVAGVTLAMMTALAAVLGNTGHAVKEKIEVQNVADATAIAATEQMARGMNAITTTNHVVGEMSAMVVMLEAFGGPEVDVGIKGNPPQTFGIDQAIRSIGSNAAITGLPVWVPAPVHNADKKFLDNILKLVVGQGGNKREHAAFATIYDAKMTLKRQLIKHQLIKMVANGALLVPPPWGAFVAPFAYGVHGYSSYEILQIAKEWLILEAMEKMVSNDGVKRLKRLTETQIIPALVSHGDWVSGYADVTGKKTKDGSQKGGVVSETVAAARRQTGERLKASTFLVPHSEKLRMPVVAEPEPLLGLKRDENWGGEPELSSVVSPLDILKMQNKLDDAQDELDDSEEETELALQNLDTEEKLIRKRLDSDDLDLDARAADAANPDLTEEQRQEMEEVVEEATQEREDLAKELDAIAETRAVRDKALVKIKKGQKKMREERPATDAALAQLATLDPKGGNPSPDNLPDKLIIGDERYSQWVRATYPYVDAMRGAMLTTMRDHMSRSKTAEHFVKWSDRYTLVKAWQFRSGHRFQKNGNALKGTWVADKEKPLTLYVMKGSFRKDSGQPTTAGGKRANLPRKGFEMWTGDDDDAKLAAEQMFVVSAIAHRDFEPSFNSTVFPAGTDFGATTFAQAIVYNANPQRPIVPDDDQPNQAVVGWDTLNWDPETNTPEWGSEPSDTGEKIWPWELFDAMKDQPGIRVKLNWQAKLVPVTESRMNEVFTEFVQQGAGHLISDAETAKDVAVNLGTVRAIPHEFIHH